MPVGLKGPSTRITFLDCTGMKFVTMTKVRSNSYASHMVRLPLDQARCASVLNTLC
jgi:hypothetical protein